jgi:hypothetical protein
MIKTIILFFTFLFILCQKNPIQKGEDKSNIEVSYFFVNNIRNDSVEIFWGCSSDSEGFLGYGRNNIEKWERSILKNKFHFVRLTGLSSGTTYRYFVACRNELLKTSYEKLYRLETFTTKQPILTRQVLQRGIWILGGIGSDGNPVSQIDLFDPVENSWYPNLATIPTPRSYASIVSIENKIYIIGGITGSGANTSSSSVVEELTINENSFTWKTMANAPASIQGALGGVVGNSIYLIGGAVTTNVASAIPNIVYKFTPSLGSLGTWVTINTLSSIPARVDLSGCVIDGTIFFNNGRDTSGNKQFTSDAYLPPTNSVTAITEASFSIDKYGSASACYNSKSTDPFPSDPPIMFIAGGSTNNNTTQPPTAILATERFEFYNTPSSTNTVVVGSNLPEKLYYPSMEVSYEKRRLYIFGGASVVNIPRTSIYSLDLSNPSSGIWNTETIQMPTARYGHKSILLFRY